MCTACRCQAPPSVHCRQIADRNPTAAGRVNRRSDEDGALFEIRVLPRSLKLSVVVKILLADSNILLSFIRQNWCLDADVQGPIFVPKIRRSRHCRRLWCQFSSDWCTGPREGTGDAKEGRFTFMRYCSLDCH